MMKKSVLLFLALGLPVSIFLFLHFFGSNEFDIPVYYQSPLAELPTDCSSEYQFPYTITKTSLALNGTSVVFFASELSTNELDESVFQLNRIFNEFESNPPRLTIVLQSTDTLSQPALAQAIVLDKESYTKEQQCIFLAYGNRLVLVDSLRQIRGLYSRATLKEVDRLILELKILFKEY